MDFSFYIGFVLAYTLLIPGAIMCLLPVKNHLRIPIRKLSLILFPCLILYSLLMPFVEWQFLTVSHNILFTATFFLCFPLYCMAVDMEKLKLFFLFLSNIALLSFGGISYHMIDAYIVIKNIDSPFYDTAFISQWFITVILMCFVFLPFMCRKLTWILEHFHTKSVWRITWIVPALITFCNYDMIPKEYKNLTTERFFTIYLVIDFTLLSLFLLFEEMFYQIAKTLIEKNEQEKKTQFLEIHASQYQNLLHYMSETSKLRHDFRHTAHTLLSLAQENDMEKILHYLREYNQELDSLSVYFFCRHTAANAILSYYADIISPHCIQTNWNIDLPDTVPVSDVDLCTILGNLLENAIQGCMDVPEMERFINLSADMTKNGELYLICINSFNGRVKLSGTKYLSTKQSGNGIGLLSITATAEKYDGMTRFYHSDSEFTSEVMLSLGKR